MTNTVWRVALPAALVGAVLGGGVWVLASQGGAEAAPRKATARPAVAASKYDRVSDSGNVFYMVPAGYVAVKQKGGVIMVPKADIDAGELNGFLFLGNDFALDAETQAKFKASGRKTAAQALAINAGNLANDPKAKLTEPELANKPEEDGYEVYLLLSKSEDKDAGKTRFTQYAVTFVGDRISLATRTAYGSPEKLESLGAAFDALLLSMEYRNNGAPPPARLAAALPTDLTVITPNVAATAAAPAEGSPTAGRRIKPGPGEVCRVEQKQKLLFNFGYNQQGSIPKTSLYFVPEYVCRKR